MYVYLYHFDDMPQLDLIQSFNHQYNISNLDSDVNIPSQSNFKYYSAEEFRNDYMIKNCILSDHFATLHCNIRSLNSNFDNLEQMLSELSCNFSVIGLSETRISINQENLSNNQLEGYTIVPQPSLSNAGGIGFFINHNLLYKIRHDLSESVAGLESL